MTNGKPVEVWYDGSCPICCHSRAWSEQRDRESRLRFRDFRTAGDKELAAPRVRHEATMMVRSPAGDVFEGFAAWRQILAELPGWSWVARVTEPPPIRWIGSLGYRLVARFRRALFAPNPAGADSKP